MKVIRSLLDKFEKLAEQPLGEDEKRVLQALKTGWISGQDLQKRTEMSSDWLRDTVERLKGRGMLNTKRRNSQLYLGLTSKGLNRAFDVASVRSAT